MRAREPLARALAAGAAALLLVLSSVHASATAVQVRLRTGRVIHAVSAQTVGDTVLVRLPSSTLRIPSRDVIAIVAEPGSRQHGDGALNLPAAPTSEPRQADVLRAERPEASGPTPSFSASTPAGALSVDALRTLLVDRPDDGPLRLALARRLVDGGRLTEALAELARIPADASAALCVEKALASADVLTHLDRPEEALAALDAAPAGAADPRLARMRASIRQDAAPRADAFASTHFRVHAPPGLDDFDAAPLLDELERAHELIEAALGPGPSEPIIVLLYAGDEFWEATGQPGSVGGLFDGKIRVPAGRVLPPSARLTEVLRHEVCHAFIHVIAAGRASAWWHEGVAEHFEGDAIGPTFRALEARARSAAAWPPPLTHEIAHARMEWFVERYGMSAVAEVLRQTARSGEPAATRKVTGLSVAELDAAWRAALSEAR